MFGFFKKKKQGTPTVDRVFLHQPAKWAYCRRLIETERSVLFLAWFQETMEAFEKEFASLSEVLYAPQVSSAYAASRKIYFLEHHPLQDKETTLFQKLNLSEALVLSSLDEPLFLYFGGDRIAGTLERLGLQEGEPVEHSLISSSISRAQDKIARQLSLEQPARSQAEWLRMNLKA